MKSSGTFVRRPGTPWPEGFVPKVADPFEGLYAHLEWLEQYPYDLQCFIEECPKEIHCDLRQLSEAGLREYQNMTSGGGSVQHDVVMRQLLFTVNL